MIALQTPLQSFARRICGKRWTCQRQSSCEARSFATRLPPLGTCGTGWPLCWPSILSGSLPSWMTSLVRKPTASYLILHVPGTTSQWVSCSSSHRRRELSSSRCYEVLAMIAAQIEGCTFSVERLHSRNMRRSKHRICTQHADLRHLALNHMGYAGPQWLRDLRLRCCEGASSKKRGRPKKQQPPLAHPKKKLRRKNCGVSGSASVASSSAQTSQSGGGGGAWRSFLHSRMQGKWKAHDMQAWKLAYRALPEAEKQFHYTLGSAGQGSVHLTIHSRAC